MGFGSGCREGGCSIRSFVLLTFIWSTQPFFRSCCARDLSWINTRPIMATSSGFSPPKIEEILSGCHFMFSIDIVLNIIAGTLASGGAFWKKALTFASVTSARRPDMTGQGMLSSEFSCLFSVQKEELSVLVEIEEWSSRIGHL